MSRRSFSDAERFAIYTVHGERCWLCNEPVSLSEMEVDHIIPESLAGTDGLPSLLASLGQQADFELNSWPNLKPSHGRCNRKKSAHIFNATPLIQLELEKGQARAARVQETIENFLSDRGLSRAMSVLLTAHEAGRLSEKDYARIAELVRKRADPYRLPELQGEPFALAPWLTVVGDSGHLLTLHGAAGVGYRPKGPHVHSSYDCPYCGPTGWNGSRCISCGRMIESD